MIHFFVVWDRTPESKLMQKLSEDGGFIQITSSTAEYFLQHPQTPDSCDAFFLIGTVIGSVFYTTAKALRERETTALRQIEQNLTQLAILNDEIRNPKSACSYHRNCQL